MFESINTYKRMGIFVFYDAIGVMDEYAENLLESIQREVQKLIVIVNGTIVNSAYHR